MIFFYCVYNKKNILMKKCFFLQTFNKANENNRGVQNLNLHHSDEQAQMPEHSATISLIKSVINICINLITH